MINLDKITEIYYDNNKVNFEYENGTSRSFTMDETAFHELTSRMRNISGLTL